MMGLDIVEFIVATEKEFALSLPDDEISLISTVGELTDVIHKKLRVKHGFKACASNNDVFEKIKDILVERQRLSRSTILRNSRFAQDLQMD